MPDRQPGFVDDVKKLMPQISFEQVCQFYGADVGEIAQVDAEIRTRCFLNCGKTEATGNRALKVMTGHPSKLWRCHQYGCGKGGDLVDLCHLIKGGSDAEKPRGARFKEIVGDMRDMVAGVANASPLVKPRNTPAPQPTKEVEPPTPNVPLHLSDNERVRSIADLDEKFLTEIAGMTPAASSYLRKRPWLTPDVCKHWRVGYLPSGDKQDRRGGTMRGRIVYGLHNEEGDILTWFGRDPAFEEKHAMWRAGDRSKREPEKVHFVKGFARGQELYGQHLQERLEQTPQMQDVIRDVGLVVVEGANDVMRLDALGVPAVGLMSNTATDLQVQKIAALAHQFAGGHVLIMLDCDEAGDRGAIAMMPKISLTCSLRLAWSAVDGRCGDFKGQQPESLSADEWGRIREMVSGRFQETGRDQ